MTEPSDASAGSPIILVPAANEAAIIVPQDDARPARRWARRVEELPRGERWKRRLPDVCR
ncbi:MAG TPA: hypothetical protein VHL98_15035 [Microvirga sp.]|nr:hypothetical protein [Microvirga sp.]